MSKLQEILDIVNATEESSYNDLLDLLKPEVHNRYEAGEVFEVCIGYDPISYYDKKEIVEKVKTLDTSNMPEGVASVFNDKVDRISEFAHEYFDNRRPEFMDEVIAEAVSDVTGWSPSDDFDDVDDIDYTDTDDEFEE